MALNPGNRGATLGMARDIFNRMDELLGEDLPDDLDQGQTEEIRAGWRKLSFAIAQGVIFHLTQSEESAEYYAVTRSDAEHDEPYWSWLTSFAGAFRTWASNPINQGPAGTPLERLRHSILEPSANVPTSLHAIIETAEEPEPT